MVAIFIYARKNWNNSNFAQVIQMTSAMFYFYEDEYAANIFIGFEPFYDNKYLRLVPFVAKALKLVFQNIPMLIL